jgi:hypothetical protein
LRNCLRVKVLRNMLCNSKRCPLLPCRGTF